MISYFDAEQKVTKRMEQNPTIPGYFFDTLVHDEFLGTAVAKPKKDSPEVSSEVEKMDLGTEPEDWDLLNDGMPEQEVLE